MHTLRRCVRFSVNPFLDETPVGFNSFCSKPCGEGLSLFLELEAELAGPVEPTTGFVVNVAQIDREVRGRAAPLLAEAVGVSFRRGEHIGLDGLASMLGRAWEKLQGRFGAAELEYLAIHLNPNRTLAMKRTQTGGVYFSERFEFPAMHRLWNDKLSEQRNFELFGKCANPTGHGHNYIVEVTVEKRADDVAFRIAEFERVVDAELIRLVDHKNLNVDVAAFAKLNPTIENLAVFAWERLAGKFSGARLDCVTVWESERTYCTYRGQGNALGKSKIKKQKAKTHRKMQK